VAQIVWNLDIPMQESDFVHGLDAANGLDAESQNGGQSELAVLAPATQPAQHSSSNEGNIAGRNVRCSHDDPVPTTAPRGHARRQTGRNVTNLSKFSPSSDMTR
jgi:hypothetical protein